MLNAKIITNKIEWQTKTRGNLQHRGLNLMCSHKSIRKKNGNIRKECYQAIHIGKDRNSEQTYENTFD